MQILAVFAHPSPKSFNRSVLATLSEVASAKGHECAIIDLYAENFNPVLSDQDFDAFNRGQVPDELALHQQHIKNADIVFFIHPLWWFGMPAIFKGWIDRVFSYGFAYSHDSRGVKPLLAGKKGVILNTAGGAEKISYDKTGFKDAIIKLNDIAIYEFVGIDIILRRFFFEIQAKSEAERREMLEVLKHDLEKIL